MESPFSFFSLKITTNCAIFFLSIIHRLFFFHCLKVHQKHSHKHQIKVFRCCGTKLSTQIFPYPFKLHLNFPYKQLLDLFFRSKFTNLKENMQENRLRRISRSLNNLQEEFHKELLALSTLSNQGLNPQCSTQKLDYVNSGLSDSGGADFLDKSATDLDFKNNLVRQQLYSEGSLQYLETRKSRSFKTANRNKQRLDSSSTGRCCCNCDCHLNPRLPATHQVRTNFNACETSNSEL